MRIVCLVIVTQLVLTIFNVMTVVFVRANRDFKGLIAIFTLVIEYHMSIILYAVPMVYVSEWRDVLVTVFSL